MSDSSSLPDISPLCIRRFESDDDVVEVRQKGADSINAASIQRGYDIVVALGRFESDDNVAEVRQKRADGISAASIQRGYDIVIALGCKVHSDCRKRDINQHDIANQQKKVNFSKLQLKRSAHVSNGAFDSKSDCLFCGTVIDLGGSDYSYVKTDQFSRIICERCKIRSDLWSFTVTGRIEYYSGDLHADCIYHHACSVNFSHVGLYHTLVIGARYHPRIMLENVPFDELCCTFCGRNINLANIN